MAWDLFVFVPESIKDIIKSKYLHKTNFLTCVFNHGGGLCAFHILFNHQYGGGGGTRVGQGAPISLHAPGVRQSLHQHKGSGLGVRWRRGAAAARAGAGAGAAPPHTSPRPHVLAPHAGSAPR